jgi:hypothetical protein
MVVLISALIFCIVMQAREDIKAAGIQAQNIIAKHMVDLDDYESTVTRHIDCEAGTVIWVANSKTYGHAIGIAVIPIRDTLLLFKEVCDGTNKAK